jgi:hypothetical protein
MRTYMHYMYAHPMEPLDQTNACAAAASANNGGCYTLLIHVIHVHVVREPPLTCTCSET